VEKDSKNILAIDVGSTKVCAIIAEVKDGGEDVRIIGAGFEKSQGLKRGSITNIDVASRSIKTAFENAKRVAGTFETEAIVSISGAYAKSFESTGIVNVAKGEITLTEIDRVMQTAKYNANVSADYDILHILPYNFKVDEQDFVEDPLGMNASRLEVFVHIITTPKSNFNNLKRAIDLAGLKVKTIVLNSYASSIATVNYDEKSLGVCVIDMGGNTSSFVIHAGGNAIRYNGFLGVGSNHITNDLSMALHTPVNVAESVKITYGNLNLYSDDLIELPVIGDETSTHEVPLNTVGQVIHARVAETLQLLSQQIDESKLKRDIGAGFVLTGGLTKLDGIRDLAMNILNAPVRLAKPRHLTGLFDSLRDPAFSTSIGLIMYSTGNYSLYEFDSNGKMKYKKQSLDSSQDEIILNDIAPSNIGMIPSSQNYPSYNKPMQQKNSEHQPSQDYGDIPDIHNTVSSHNLNNKFNSKSENQPIGTELNRTDYYNKGAMPMTPQPGGNQSGSFTKMWQWVTQLF
jgi:cell division protein FtsA